jgi:ankyrin repeat protein
MSEDEIKDEELNVLFHAAKLGRTDIVNHAVSTLKKKENPSQDKLTEIISTPNNDGATALHVAAFNGHPDVVRALLVKIVLLTKS